MSWSVGGLSITPSDLSVDHQTLSLTGIVTNDIDKWRKYDRSGDVETIVGAGGEFRTLSRGERSTVTVTPPADLRPTPFDTHEAYVAAYDEFQEAPGVHQVSVELRRESNRPRVYAGGDYTLSSPAFDIEFSMARVDFREDAVRRTDIQGDPAGGVWTLPLLLKDQQARIILESLSHNDATETRTVPDGANFPQDTTSNDKNLARLSVPSRATLPAGTYVVSGVSVSHYAQRRPWAVDLELRPKVGRSGAFDYAFSVTFA